MIFVPRIRKEKDRNWSKDEQLEYENMKLRIENEMLKKDST